jgi:lambda repressor-like predicted transcriptional regulator
MSTKRNAGRAPTPPTTRRGEAILAALAERGLTMSQAASTAGLTFQALYNAIHRPPEKLSVKVVAALCEKLGLPLSLVAPQIHALHKTSAA